MVCSSCPNSIWYSLHGLCSHTATNNLPKIAIKYTGVWVFCEVCPRFVSSSPWREQNLESPLAALANAPSLDPVLCRQSQASVCSHFALFGGCCYELVWFMFYYHSCKSWHHCMEHIYNGKRFLWLHCGGGGFHSPCNYFYQMIWGEFLSLQLSWHDVF